MNRITGHIKYPALRRNVPPFRKVGTSLGWEWQEEHTIKTMWAEGFTAGQIAAKLRTRTRSAVLGKIHRMGLPKRRKAAL